ncbi:flavin reductase family protein [Pseudonocardia abyssalis]|uniref:Flavin reductase family protein n=1 Tax=Pseudonocardia abyssalis TaxID=2792008 RepID=A0ABS6UVU8_9PSEU|nr:flavin reductase family protein [Pseudonocardia abyssalis]MBW0116933.1 flavin reductase family protein [Pseudonocardia abyssalis]MBW0136307.1 flavin reductase family protein [Pseudonocardia abyssalis]
MFEAVIDEKQLRRAFGCFPSGIAAICADVDGTPIGVAASSFTSVSLEPPLVSVSMRHASTTWPSLRTRRRLGLSVLGEEQEGVCRRLAGAADHRFSESDWTSSTGGGVFVEGATLWLDCSIHAEVPAGDHDVILLRVHNLRVDPDIAPLVFHGSRFRRLATA